MPGNLAGWAFVLAIVFAWAFISAFVEPFVIAALMQVYFKTIEGQVPDPEWDRRLAETSRQFRELKDKALASVGGSRWGASASPTVKPVEHSDASVPAAWSSRRSAPISGHGHEALFASDLSSST